MNQSMNLNEWAREIHANAVEHGFWEPKMEFNTALMLIVGEIAEAMEEHRAGRPMVWHKCNLYGGECGDTCDYMVRGACECGNAQVKPEGIAVEMADALIRILDWFGSEGLDVEAIVREKHEYNKTRPYKHGKRY